ncbi:MAG: hypothetical protein U5K37_06235 [Natrialbaceae archaeon]|nr:hypothetical protein [Natrialbaceae archaeon]
MAERVSKIPEPVYRELEVLLAVEESISRSALEDAVDLSPEDVDSAIDRLIEKDVITVEDDGIIRKSTNL